MFLIAAQSFGLLATSNSCVTNIFINFAGASNAVFSVEAWVNGGAQTTDVGLVTKGYGSGGEQFKRLGSTTRKATKRVRP